MEKITTNEHLRQLFLRIVAYCPSVNQCVLGDRELLAANAQVVLEAANEGLEILTGRPSNVAFKTIHSTDGRGI
jgi:hypothetical protein